MDWSGHSRTMFLGSSMFEDRHTPTCNTMSDRRSQSYTRRGTRDQQQQYMIEHLTVCLKEVRIECETNSREREKLREELHQADVKMYRRDLQLKEWEYFGADYERSNNTLRQSLSRKCSKIRNIEYDRNNLTADNLIQSRTILELENKLRSKETECKKLIEEKMHLSMAIQTEGRSSIGSTFWEVRTENDRLKEQIQSTDRDNEYLNDRLLIIKQENTDLKHQLEQSQYGKRYLPGDRTQLDHGGVGSLYWTDTSADSEHESMFGSFVQGQGLQSNTDSERRLQRELEVSRSSKIVLEQRLKALSDENTSVSHQRKLQEKENTDIQTQRDTLQLNTTKLNRRIECLNREIKTLQDNCNRLEEHNRKGTSLTESNNTLQQKISQLEKMNEENHAQISHLEVENRKLNSDICDLRSNKDVLLQEKTDITVARRDIVKQEDYKDIVQELEKTRASSRELEQNDQSMRDSKEVVIQNVEVLEIDLAAFEKKKDKHQLDTFALVRQIDTLNKEIERLQHECKRRDELEAMEKQLTEMCRELKQELEAERVRRTETERKNNILLQRTNEDEQNIRILKRKADELQKEKDNLLFRLSQIASSKLTEGNPSIVDLSDEKRPTKLAEVYSELYDNEWTDAFDEQIAEKDVDEECVIAILLDILVRTHTVCQNTSTTYMDGLATAVCTIEGRTLFTIGAGGDGPIELNKILRQIRHISCQRIQYIIEQDLDDALKQKKYVVGTHTQAYIEKCLQLCWDMSVKEPPVVLTSLPAVGSDYDKNRYRFYTESGPTVGYTVWPGMLLYEGGPTLAKGVVQGAIQ